MGGMRLRPRSAAALLVASTLLAVVLAALPAPASAAATTLSILGGTASVTRAGVATAPAVDGQQLLAGDELTTSADGHAILTFVDGSTLTLEPGTTVAVEEVTARPTSVVVRVLQSVGRTWSSVTRLLAAGSRYEIRTPAITATVRGTAFEVIVGSDGTTRVRSAEGEVRVANALGEVVVGQGAETVASPTAPPAPPATPSPATRRVIEVGDRPIIVVDTAGRGCGRTPTGVVQQIPGCVVRDGSIEILDAARVGDYRLAVVGELASAGPVVERTIPADATAPQVVRELALPEAGAAATQRIVVPPATATARPTIEVTLPFIGTVPVQLDLATPAPSARIVPAPLATAAPSAIATAVPTIVVSPSPIVTPAPTPTLVPTSAPVVTAIPSVQLPTATPIVTLAPTPVPTLVPSPAITLAPTPQILPTPTPAPTPTPSPTATASPAPTVTPGPTPTPTATPTATPCVTDILRGVICLP